MIHPRLSIICAAALLLVADHGFNPDAGVNPVLAQTETQTGEEVEIPTPPGEAAETEEVGGATLYQRLGGYDVVAEVVDDFLKRMGEDESLQRFLKDMSDADLRRFRQSIVDFICEKTGGPCFYTGPDMEQAHEGTGITAADWERASELMGTTLDARGIQDELREEFGGFIAGLRDDMVDVE